VSAGTYIRALARDLGRMLGCGGALADLRRTAIGPMAPDPALALEPDGKPHRERLRAALIPLERMPLALPALRLAGPEETRRFLHGGAVATPAGSPAEGLAAVHSAAGALLGVALISGATLAPRVVLPPSGS
jgi:tRNA pseudouridine55 synthase